MPGFVDVSNMTSEEVRRMGHADDYDEPETWRPRKSTSARATPVPQVGYAVSDVWAAACAAQRVNGEYVKEAVYEHLEGQALVEPPALVKRKSRDVMMEFLTKPDELTVADVEQGEELRRWLQNDLTFRALKSKLTEFDSATQKCLAVKDRFYVVSERYELAVVAALPNIMAKAKAREATQDRLAETTGELIGSVGDKVQLNVEVIRSMFSKNWNIWFLTAITETNSAVFFSCKESYDTGTHLTIRGTVKAHKDGQTQLNRVSII
jgi:hypothetical protein